MIYKLLHKVFGWDYVLWSNNNGHSGVARVLVLPDGTVFYWAYKSIKVADVLTPSMPTSRAMWLTCTKDKYFPAPQPIKNGIHG